MPEAGRAVPCADPAIALAPSAFETPALQLLLRFVVTCGGAGLSQTDQEALAALLHCYVPSGTADANGMALRTLLPTPYALVAAVRAEHRRVLAVRSWKQVPITVGDGTYQFYFRDVLQCGKDVLRHAEDVQLLGEAMAPGADGSKRRTHTLNSDIFLKEQASVMSIHGAGARVVGTVLHADEAVISWNGGNYVYPVRVQFVNVRDGGGIWVTVGYSPHVPKVVGDGKTARARRAVSDARNDLVQRCMAVAFESFMRASQHGVVVDIPSLGRVFFVPRVVGTVVDQVEERRLLGLMGSGSMFNCSRCLTRRHESCDIDGPSPARRPVVTTLQAQLEATEARRESGRPRTRVALARTMSALPFMPFLGAIHGLATGDANLYRVVSLSFNTSQDAMDDGWGAGSSEEPVDQEGEPGLLVRHPMYRSLFGNVFLEDAVLRMFCQTAKLSGLLFGDNQAHPEVTSEADIKAIMTVAEDLNKYIQVLLGPVATTKLHRLLHHLGDELRNRGNLWEGDTSENESRHAAIKQMFRRSSKSGDTLLLQMLKAEETQSEVLHEMEKVERREARDVSGGCLPPDDQRFNGEEAELVDLLRVNQRGVAVALTSVAARSGLAALAAVLGVAEESTLFVANTIKHLAFFEWGANRAKQQIRGSDSFRGSPWYSHIRYRGAHNETRWGLVRVVIREAAGVVRPCVVVQRFRQTDARPGCVLSEFGCQRLRWDFASSSDEWPRIDVVDVASILRLEQIHPDWMDSVDRHGVHAMPSIAPKTAEERRLAKFFTNAFYAWTTRPLKVIL
ncbi:hypothetical protein I4F81_005047 [Pyropia yezoensis]|uniref:Uncharacterized protein n=1 Tax=Pyropia yezoensis TaxID=2788 RepID=A0ACC3BXQ0_PYRYE|nr:hypothetical protein I4F81_005047 [Neopyropia yezoensis]|eukprot:contig_5949_g1349